MLEGRIGRRQHAVVAAADPPCERLAQQRRLGLQQKGDEGRMRGAVEVLDGFFTAKRRQRKRQPPLIEQKHAGVGRALGFIDFVENDGERARQLDRGHQSRDQPAQAAAEGELLAKKDARRGFFEAGFHGLEQDQDQRAGDQGVRQKEAAPIADPQKQHAVDDGKDQRERTKDEDLAEQLMQVEQARRQDRL